MGEYLGHCRWCWLDWARHGMFLRSVLDERQDKRWFLDGHRRADPPWTPARRCRGALQVEFDRNEAGLGDGGGRTLGFDGSGIRRQRGNRPQNRDVAIRRFHRGLDRARVGRDRIRRRPSRGSPTTRTTARKRPGGSRPAAARRQHGMAGRTPGGAPAVWFRHLRPGPRGVYFGQPQRGRPDGTGCRAAHAARKARELRNASGGRGHGLGRERPVHQVRKLQQVTARTGGNRVRGRMPG